MLRRRKLDLLHKSAVCFLIGLTAYGSGLCGLRVYHYFNVIRPAQQLLKQNEERQLLQNEKVDDKRRFISRVRSSYDWILSSRFLHNPTFNQQNLSKLWNLGKLNHIAVATSNLEETSSFYRDVLGAKISEPVPLPEHGVTTVFVELGNTKIELLHPLGDKSPIAKYLEKNKLGGMHHICIEVDDINSAIKELKDRNIRCLTENSVIGAHGKPVIFLHPKDCAGVLIELEEA